LRSAGKWIAAHPQVIYGAGPSPWRHALPWGDVTTNNGKLYISVYHWPISGKLYIPGIHSDMREARLMEGKQHQRLSLKKEGSWLVVNTPMSVPNSLVSVIELTPVNTNNLSVDSIQAVDPDFGTEISAKFATVKGGNAYKKYWMEKFGEWKTAFVVEKWTPDTSVSWQFEVKKPGMYQIGLKYTGDSRLAWSVDNEEGQHVQNQQGASSTYDTHPLGWMKFTKAGKHQLTVRLLEGKMESVSLQSIDIKYIDF
jgi:alpha-L-fucosidase